MRRIGYAMLRYQSEVPGNHQQNKEAHGQANADRQVARQLA
jgi:hypothetical protein